MTNRRNTGVLAIRRVARRTPRRAFSLVELLIALAISASLLTATLVALNASFIAYQSTTEQASTHTVGRLVLHRLLTMIRAGQDFRPMPGDIRERFVQSEFLEFFHPDTGQVITVTWDAATERLLYQVDGGDEVVLLEGVVAQTDADNNPRLPFLLEWEPGRFAYRVTIDLMIVPDDNLSMDAEEYIEGLGDDEAGDGSNNLIRPIRLVASAMPRSAAF